MVDVDMIPNVGVDFTTQKVLVNDLLSVKRGCLFHLEISMRGQESRYSVGCNTYVRKYLA